MRTELLRLRLMVALMLPATTSCTCSDEADVAQLRVGFSVDPGKVDFGRVQAGTRAERELLVQNTGSAALTVTVSRAEPFDEHFSFEPTTLSIAPSSVALTKVYFSPDEVGALRAVIRLDAGRATPIEVELLGEGVRSTLVVEPQTLSFGNVIVGTEKTLSVTLTNGSDLDTTIEYGGGLNVRPCTAQATEDDAFCVVSRERPFGAEGRFVLPSGASTALDVTFAPKVTGTRERGTFLLKTCPLEACEIEIRLDGVGIEQGFACAPAALDFGLVNPGACVSKAVRCENAANEPVNVAGWRLSSPPGGVASTEFGIPTSSARIVAPGDALEIPVEYCPTTLGEDRGVLEVETTNANPRLRWAVVALQGSGGGADIDVLPERLNFGQVSLIAPARRRVTILNVGHSDLQVTEIRADTATTGAFKTIGAGPTVVPVGGFVDVVVEFQPLVEGLVTSELWIDSVDQDEPRKRVLLTGEGVSLPPCSFEVAPSQLAFGAVERSRTLSRAFEVRNTGTDDCLVTAARLLPDSDSAFSMPDGELASVRIAPRSSTTIRVAYSPMELGTHRGTLEFSISSPRSPFNNVPLTGAGVEASLLVVPNDLDFGVIGVPCAARARTVTVYNTGSTPATLSAIAFAAPANPAFTLSNLPALPFTLAPGASTTFDIAFRTRVIGAYAGAVEITSNVGGRPTTSIVSLLGKGAENARQADDFEQLGRPKVDILFVIDDSGSMGEEQTSLGQNFGSFIQFAEDQGIDYQIAVTTTDIDTGGAEGRFVSSNNGPRIVTPNTLPTPDAVFTANANVGTLGSAFERGLEAAYLALSNPLIFADNAGFLRSDAVLSIIFVSDEEDQAENPVDFFVNFFLSIKGFRNTNLFSASAIVGDVPGGCNGTGGNAVEGARYVETANRTGGVFQSICTSDWSRALENLSTTAFGFKSRFFLSNQPVVSSLDVLVDGRPVEPTGNGGAVNWTYDLTTNSINFSPAAIPEPGQEIHVEYGVQCL